MNMPRALLSVYDKTNLVKFASALIEMGWDIVATGGTEQLLRSSGVTVVAVETLTGMPEMLGGRVKTLHPAVHAGILARDKPEDLASLQQFGYAPINMVVCNLYPFQETASQIGITLQDAIEQIDIGGVTLLRAAAKNFFHTIVVCDPEDYAKVAAELKATGKVDLATRRKLAVKAFAHTRDYDTAIHAFLSQDVVPSLTPTDLPQHLSLGMQQVEVLRYGENPHQPAAYYSRVARSGPLGGALLGGKQLSYNNILDLDAAWRAVSSFSEPTVVIVKHLNPIGVASALTLAEAYPLALAADEVSAFGGVIAVNRPVDDAFVNALGSLFVEAIAAPGYSSSAQAQLLAVRKNCRLLSVPQPFAGNELEIRSVLGGVLVQSADTGDPEATTLKTVTERMPTPEELEMLQFAWKVVQHVRSNAIVLARAKAAVGIGGGLPSRVDSVRLAVAKAGDRAKGAVMASDAFFPFADGIQVAAEAGVTAVIQPGGSIRDKEAIQAANDAGMAMIFTGVRHFRH
ncbi:MAG: bifunctional phosphoribosylaminoimidazolecarboxamide formyltransferase/IMP cyclohydrolase PurH [Chloroflexi bacterium]|nr:bifunctional phosphoribosylaminoimidazolecarboxamide formyltransferase/IMP cyclohydrolase PurH [Chloroflexota bacterium]MDL1883909.1 bifunctional phosphoribosylaminoimidazolecarboxamide formyltransferase/IMP cyclohydrolase [Anaerolineae bacterium CFX8]